MTAFVDSTVATVLWLLVKATALVGLAALGADSVSATRVRCRPTPRLDLCARQPAAASSRFADAAGLARCRSVLSSPGPEAPAWQPRGQGKPFATVFESSAPEAASPAPAAATSTAIKGPRSLIARPSQSRSMP